MTIKSNLTGKTQDIKPATWEKIKAKGEASKYTIVTTGTGGSEAPKDVAKADYAALAKEAAAAYEARDYAKAKELYEAAYKIKQTKFVGDKIEDLKRLLGRTAPNSDKEAGNVERHG